MLQTTQGIVLRSIKYGETSLIVSMFTRSFGRQSYMVQGVRSARARQQKAALLQPATLLDLVSYQKPQRSLLHLREYQLAHFYTSVQQDIVKNSIALFSVELLLRLLPEEAPLEDFFEFCFDYFVALDKGAGHEVANFPIYFALQITRFFGYDIKGAYSAQTPYLNLEEGGFSNHVPAVPPFVHDHEAKAISQLLHRPVFSVQADVQLSADSRYRLLDWLVAYLQQHTQHLGEIRSLTVLRTILH